jgi:hypothetical protein
MTALWQRYENRQVQPTAPAPEVQARLSALEKEVATLKALLQSKDEELASRDLIISEERSATSRLKNKVFEANERYTRSVTSLSAELDRTDQLASRLLAVQNECSEACKNAENAEAEKEKLKVEVERLEAKRDKALSEATKLCAISSRPELGLGIQLGFENFRTLVTNPKYKFDPETVGPHLVGFPNEAVQEMEDFGKEFMPDVPSWGADTPDLREDPLEEAAG